MSAPPKLPPLPSGWTPYGDNGFSNERGDMALLRRGAVTIGYESMDGWIDADAPVDVVAALLTRAGYTVLPPGATAPGDRVAKLPPYRYDRKRGIITDADGNMVARPFMWAIGDAEGWARWEAFADHATSEVTEPGGADAWGLLKEARDDLALWQSEGPWCPDTRDLLARIDKELGGAK